MRTCFQSEDWVAILLKNYRSGRVVQRVGSLASAASESVQAWLCAMNARRYNVYVSVNAIRRGERSRTRHAIAAVRHVFLEFDANGAEALQAVEARPDLPAPSYVLLSSPGRIHVLWRVEGFDGDAVEQLQRLLAAQLGADIAATPVTQTTRIPGYVNHKYDEPPLVTVEYRDPGTVLTPSDFPRPRGPKPVCAPNRSPLPSGTANARERALLYLRHVPPAVSGQHGDLHTFQTCCRVVRGFALDEDDALDVLDTWNAQCRPPWTEAELREKLRRARRYGRETIGGLL